MYVFDGINWLAISENPFPNRNSADKMSNGLTFCHMVQAACEHDRAETRRGPYGQMVATACNLYLWLDWNVVTQKGLSMPKRHVFCVCVAQNALAKRQNDFLAFFCSVNMCSVCMYVFCVCDVWVGEGGREVYVCVCVFVVSYVCVWVYVWCVLVCVSVCGVNVAIYIDICNKRNWSSGEGYIPPKTPHVSCTRLKYLSILFTPSRVTCKCLFCFNTIDSLGTKRNSRYRT